MPKKEERYVVGGFVFTSKQEAEQAKKEVEGIKFVKEKTNMNKPEMVLQVYNKMVGEKLFVTSVGYSYLYDVQEYLLSIPSIDREMIRPIEVVHPSLQESLKEEKQKHQAKLSEAKKKAEKKNKSNTDVEQKYKRSMILNLILAIGVAGMFLITATGNHPTILNYEKELINRYAAWEQELTEREDALREASLNEAENP